MVNVHDALKVVRKKYTNHKIPYYFIYDDCYIFNVCPNDNNTNDMVISSFVGYDEKQSQLFAFYYGTEALTNSKKLKEALLNTKKYL